MGTVTSRSLAAEVPATPGWQTSRNSKTVVSQPVRITVPDADSCIRTGRHRERIDFVPVDNQGRPQQAWTYGTLHGLRTGASLPHSPATTFVQTAQED